MRVTSSIRFLLLPAIYRHPQRTTFLISHSFYASKLCSISSPPTVLTGRAHNHTHIDTQPFTTTAMSWMDSWSRPSKNTATPPPLYLTDENTKYCATCGRVIGARRSHQKNKVVRYCSDGCRKHRIGPLDKKIDRVILGVLSGDASVLGDGHGEESVNVGKVKKGDKRVLVGVDEIERIVFAKKWAGGDGDATKEGEEKEELTADEATDGSVGHESDVEDGGGVKMVDDEDKVHSHDEGEKAANSQDEAPADTRRQEGQRRADEREKVRRAARRAVVFGFPVEVPDATPSKNKSKAKDKEAAPEETHMRKCEAVMSSGQVVEPSFAKGNWSIRWRE